MNPYPDDTFLARWLNQDLSPEEQQTFEKTEDCKRLSLIWEAAGEFEAAVFDEQRVLAEVKEKIVDEQSRMVRPFRISSRYWQIAAGLVLLISIAIFWWIRSSTNQPPQVTLLATAFGEQLTHQFVDGSIITLNAASELEARITRDHDHRSLTLKGEAYLEVTKGGDFSVDTELGTVQVLGTKFSVMARDHLFQVRCFEGKVLMKTPELSRADTLTQGQEIMIRLTDTPEIRAFDVPETVPSWTEGVSSYREVPFQEVINGIERQYAVSIQTAEIDLDEILTVSFPHNDLEAALDLVCLPLGIQWEQKESNILLRQ